MNSATVIKTCFNSGCQKKGSDLKVCGKCKSAWYCSAECQKSSWKKHKTDCKFLSALKDEQGRGEEDECARCQNKNGPLKKCSQCLNVLYCSKECQVAHWREHKPKCNFSQGEKQSEIVKRKTNFDDDDFEIAGIHGQDLWDEIQEKGYKLATKYKDKEKCNNADVDDVDDDDEDDDVAENLSQAVRKAKEIFSDKKVVTNFESVPSELYGFRICQGQQILVTQITGFHPETVRHGIFITDDGKLSSFVLFHVDNIPDPHPYFNWSDITPGNYMCIADPSFQKFPGKYMGFVIDDASDIRIVKGTPLDSEQCQSLMQNMKTHSH